MSSLSCFVFAAFEIICIYKKLFIYFIGKMSCRIKVALLRKSATFILQFLLCFPTR